MAFWRFELRQFQLCKDLNGVLALSDTMGFVSQTASQVSVCEGLRFAKVVRDLNIFFMCFY
jgi:hypothetical protein